MSEQNDDTNTAWGLIVGVGCVSLFMVYAVSSGALQGGSGNRACNSCRQAANVPAEFSRTNEKER